MAEAEYLFDLVVKAAILMIELAGIVIIVISMVRGFIGYLRHSESIRIDLAQGIMLGLEFKIGSEVLRSVIVSGWNELGTLAAIILLRSLLPFTLGDRCGRKASGSKSTTELCAGYLSNFQFIGRANPHPGAEPENLMVLQKTHSGPKGVQHNWELALSLLCLCKQ